jgi:chromosome segregation ATPase
VDLTVEILKEIREELRGLRADQRDQGERMDAFARDSSARFEVIETTLRDLAQQMVLLSRAVKTALEAREDVREQLDDHEQRLRALESGSG